MEGVGNALLAGDHLVIQRPDAIGLTLERDLQHWSRNADAGAKFLGNRRLLAIGPTINIGERIDHRIDNLRVG